mmetsp:Transcript_104246/g.290388  ORF Transcript_104246/g.290388 Transcript_104246/m.290388 type:complete len:202 (+) Transcript_104246:746-1351(+)
MSTSAMPLAGSMKTKRHWQKATRSLCVSTMPSAGSSAAPSLSPRKPSEPSAVTSTCFCFSSTATLTPFTWVRSAAFPLDRRMHRPPVFVTLAWLLRTPSPTMWMSGSASASLPSLPVPVASELPSSSASSSSLLDCSLFASSSSAGTMTCPILVVLPSGKKCLILPVRSMSSLRLVMCGSSVLTAKMLRPRVPRRAESLCC